MRVTSRAWTQTESGNKTQIERFDDGTISIIIDEIEGERTTRYMFRLNAQRQPTDFCHIYDTQQMAELGDRAIRTTEPGSEEFRDQVRGLCNNSFGEGKEYVLRGIDRLV